MKKVIAAATAAAVMAIAPATALGNSADAPGQKIENARGVSFGQLVSGGKKAGTQPHELRRRCEGIQRRCHPAAHGCSALTAASGDQTEDSERGVLQGVPFLVRALGDAHNPNRRPLNAVLAGAASHQAVFCR